MEIHDWPDTGSGSGLVAAGPRLRCGRGARFAGRALNRAPFRTGAHPMLLGRIALAALSGDDDRRPGQLRGLMAPHLARMLGLRGAGVHLAGAELVGALMLALADWLSRPAFLGSRNCSDLPVSASGPMTKKAGAPRLRPSSLRRGLRRARRSLKWRFRRTGLRPAANPLRALTAAAWRATGPGLTGPGHSCHPSASPSCCAG